MYNPTQPCDYRITGGICAHPVIGPRKILGISFGYNKCHQVDTISPVNCPSAKSSGKPQPPPAPPSRKIPVQNIDACSKKQFNCSVDNCEHIGKTTGLIDCNTCGLLYNLGSKENQALVKPKE